ncbi:MAG: peptide chain release factor 1, partial [Clostridia bacterium]|nr:peptide chain release factor 1 [Clostridia bacterium]
IVVECQEERSQYKNRDKAMVLLCSRLLAMKRQEQDEKISSERRQMVGSGDRSEKIRTYNYPQNRLTDHRINLTIYDLDSVLNGKLDQVIDPLLTADAAQKMAGADNDS